MRHFVFKAGESDGIIPERRDNLSGAWNGKGFAVLLVDDHRLLMEGERSLLAPYSHLRIGGQAVSGEEAHFLGSLAETGYLSS